MTDQELFEILLRPHHVTRKGYAIISASDCPFAWQNGQIRRSRYVAWRVGLLTDAEQTVHHKDKNKLNDSPGNLELLSRAEHSREHARDFSPLHRQRISESLTGREVSEETRARISATLRGNTNGKGVARSPTALANLKAGLAARDERYWAKNRELVDRVLELRKQKLTLLQIGAAVGRSDRRVYEILKKFGGQ